MLYRLRLIKKQASKPKNQPTGSIKTVKWGDKVYMSTLHFTDLKCDCHPVRYCESLLRGKGQQYETFDLCAMRFDAKDFGFGQGYEPIYCGSTE